MNNRKLKILFKILISFKYCDNIVNSESLKSRKFYISVFMSRFKEIYKKKRCRSFKIIRVLNHTRPNINIYKKRNAFVPV